MQFITDNWQLVFGGLGTAIVAAIVGAWAKSYFDKKAAASKPPTKTGSSQETRSGNRSTNAQAGSDASVVIADRGSAASGGDFKNSPININPPGSPKRDTSSISKKRN
jgi:hypothetical protein